MLNIIKSLNYRIDAQGNVEEVVVGFSDYSSNPNGTLSVVLRPTDVENDLLTYTPNDLQQIAKNKVIDALINGTQLEEPNTDPVPAE